MRIKLSNRGSTLIVGIIGELDHHTAEYLRQKVDEEIIKAAIKNIVFDFSKVGFMDSSGVGAIMGRYKNIRKLNGKAAIINANAQIKRIFEMSGLTKIVGIYNNVDEAIKNM